MNSEMYWLKLPILKSREERKKKNKRASESSQRPLTHTWPLRQVSERGKKWKGAGRIFEEIMSEPSQSEWKY